MELSKKYRLPWTPKDNILVWYDVTKDCGMDCDKCYTVHRPGSHKPLESIKAELEKIKKAVNFDVLTFGGGEPLRHPDLPEIVGYAKSLGFKVFVSTNGALLGPETVKKLRRAGLDGINLHIDSLQKNRGNHYGAEEKALNGLRSAYLKKLKGTGIRLYHAASLSEKNAAGAGEILKWGVENSGEVKFLVFSILRDPGGSSASETDIEGALSGLKKYYADFDFAAFLDLRDSETGASSVKWTLSALFTDGSGIFCQAGPGAIRFFQSAYRRLFGTYPSSVGGIFYRLGFFYLLLLAPFSMSYAAAFLRFLKSRARRPLSLITGLNVLPVLIVQPDSVSRDETPVFFKRETPAETAPPGPQVPETTTPARQAREDRNVR